MIKRRGEQHHGAGLVREAKSDRNAEQQRPHPDRRLQQRKAHQDEAAGDQLRRSAAAWVAGVVLALIYLQILAGGLVAGIDAGFGYNTWPLINGAFVPSGLSEASPWYLNVFENPLTVQFDHRMLGYAVVLATILQSGWLAVRRGAPELITSGFILMCLALLQATIGVWTLLLGVPIGLGLAHQAGAMVLFAAALYHLWLSLERRAPAGRTQAAASA